MPGSNSLIELHNQLDITSSVVMIDLTAINGPSTSQIADYVAMRSLVRTKPPTEKRKIVTILSLFDGSGEHPAGLTLFDISYLKGIYGVPPNLPGSAGLGAMRKDLEQADVECIWKSTVRT